MKMKKFFREHSDFIIGALLLTALYLAESALRPPAAPGEYDFLMKLREFRPDFPATAILLRLPAAAAALISGALVYALCRTWKLKRPGAAAGFFLLLPPVFYTGTAASAITWPMAGAMLCAAGIFHCIKLPRSKKRALWFMAVIAGAAFLWFFVRSCFFEFSMLWILLCPLFALICARSFDKKEHLDKERLIHSLNRMSSVSIGILIALSLVVIIPALLFHFKVDFPSQLAFYQRGERIVRPMLFLLTPLFWLILAKQAKKISRKLLLLSGAAGFILLLLPLVLPWKNQKEIYLHYTFASVAKHIPAGNTICFTEKKYASFYREFFKSPVRIIGNGPNETKPEKLAGAVINETKQHNVLVIYTGSKMDKFCPSAPGTRYTVGKHRIFRYNKGVEQ